jgi:hypothetical protein
MDEARKNLQQRYAGNQQPITVGLLDSVRQGHLSLVRSRQDH